MKKNTKIVRYWFIILLTYCISAKAVIEPLMTDRPDVQEFIQYMVEKHQFDGPQLNQWLSAAQSVPTIIQSISKPAESLPWFKYRKIFITPKRVDSGVAFWASHQDILKQASERYGVPEEVIIAILGVETFYGQYAGKHRVLDALATLAFDYPPRSKFFKRELEEFLLLSREEKWNPSEIMGSYAGAMGKPQFIASSYRAYAIDFNQTGQRDLMNSPEDSIGSIANYFSVHGWQKNKPIAVPAITNGSNYKSLSTSPSSPKPTYTFKQIAEVGIGISGNIEARQSFDDERFALVSLEGADGMEHWLGLENFYVITRYNHSNLYAMAVFELSQKIKSAYTHKNQQKG